MKSYLVGRSRGADFRVEAIHDTVGKRHLQVSTSSAGVSIRDLGSANGTFVFQNGRWSEISGDHPVSPDSQIRMGDYVTSLRQLGFAANEGHEISEDETVVIDHLFAMLDGEPKHTTVGADGASVVYRRGGNGEIIED